ncbi:RUS1 family protein C16orf58 [Nymphon striatum]|nr:RUS1 family protein C16orf58 [Nymphon striatum]
MVEELRNASSKVGLEINLSKTKVMFNRNAEIQPIMTENVALDQVDRYIYLGQLISIHRDWEPESVFLPRGYPHSVSKDYLPYQIWDTVQAFSSSITHTLATEAVLKGIGVGQSDATLLAATVTWLLKDGTGMLGRILFAWNIGLFADILNDISIMLDLLSPMFSNYFTLIVCISGVFKSIVGVAGGATRAALTQHQAIQNNLADVSAKDGSQETLVNLLALIVSLILMPMISGHQMIIWSLFFFFTSLHIFANYRAVKSVVMQTLNQSRLHFLVNYYLESNGDILSASSANNKEPVIFLPFISESRKINIGCQISEVVSVSKEFNLLKSLFKDSNYLLGITGKKYPTLNIALSVNAKTEDILRGCFHAEVIKYLYKENPSTLINPFQLIQESTHLTERYFNKFLKSAEVQGWRTDYTLLNENEWRYSLNSVKSD